MRAMGIFDRPCWAPAAHGLKRVVVSVFRSGLWLSLLGALAWPLAQAQTVTLAGRMGERALLVIDGQARTLAPGQSAGAVRLLRWVGEEAEIELQGNKQLLRQGGQAAMQAGPAVAPSGRDIVLTAGSGGHFVTDGAINGRSVRFMVDTGATLVAMGRPDAERLGLDLSAARPGVSQTANGPVAVQLITLSSVRVGAVQIANVNAVVLPQALPYLLLGNSFLSRFQMQRDNDVMRLQLR